jgi:large subunit ribosomal protein L22
MSQSANPRRLSESEALASAKMIRSSPQKLNIVAQLIRGKSASDALASLTFCERRVAHEVKKVLQAAIANAENNHRLDVDQLIVSQATVGRALVMKRFHTRGRGRSSRIEKPYSNLTVIVAERSATAEGDA